MQKPRIKMVDGWWRVLEPALTKDYVYSSIEFYMKERAQWWCRYMNSEVQRNARPKAR